MSLCKTADLTGNALNFAVAKASGRTLKSDPLDFSDGSYWVWEEVPSGEGGVDISQSVYMKIGGDYDPISDWAQAGPIIDREHIELLYYGTEGRKGCPWEAQVGKDRHYIDQYPGDAIGGPTVLVAAMRAFVVSRLGLYIEIPEELC